MKKGDRRKKKGFICKTKNKNNEVFIYSIDKKIEYARLKKIENGAIIRVFVHAPICDGMLAEGTNCTDMKQAIKDTTQKIEAYLNKQKTR